MSTPLPTGTLTTLTTLTTEGAAPARRRPQLPGWTREPLVHFVVLGGILFYAAHLVASGAADPHTIVVGREVDSEAVHVFEESRGRAPNEVEMRALHQVWLDNEVLYREGLAMQVDKGDDAIRERVIFKALSVIDANVKLPAIDDAQMRTWFESHRVKYDEPARFDFQEAVLAGDNSEAAVRRFVDELNSGAPGDANAGLRVFKGRPHANLVQSYGDAFATALEEAPPLRWQALQTRDGWRAIRLDSFSAPRPAVYESLRGVVRQDWKDAIASEQRTAAVRALARKYKIVFEPHDPQSGHAAK